MTENLAVTRTGNITHPIDEGIERFQQFVLNMPVMMDAFDESGMLVAWNREAERVTGFSAEEMIGNPKALELIYPDKEYRTKMLAQWINRASDYRDWEWFVACKDGTKKVVAWSNISKSFPIPGWANWSIGIDVTERKKAEEALRNSEDRLRQSQKMEAIGTLSGGIAHDFNNVLSAIFACADTALMLLPEHHQASEKIRELQSAAERAKALVRRILTFSRKSEPLKTVVELRAVVSECLKLVRASLPATVEIHENLEAAGKLVLGDPTELHQVLLNLCTNAAHAMRETGGSLTVTLSEVVVGASLLEFLPDLSPGPHLKLSVRDTGHGMPPEVIPRIFEPYFTTKEVGDGSGVGLAVVHGIVKSYGGAIGVTSKVGRGSLFEVYLPQTKLTESKNISSSIWGSMKKGSARILLVDDEVMIAKVGKQALELLGYRVMSVTSSLEALRIFKESPNDFDLVITDYTMPKMTGAELVSQIIKVRPEIRIIICSGQIDFPRVPTPHPATRIEFLIKPFTIPALNDVVHRLLEESS